MKTWPKTQKYEIKIPTVSVIHLDDEVAAFHTSTRWGWEAEGSLVYTRKGSGSYNVSSTELSLTVPLIKYSTASMDFVSPKKWRAPWPMDPGEVGVTLEPAQERVEGASKLLFASATDQSKS